MMNRETRYLKRLVDDLMDISRINLGKMSLYFDLVDLNNIMTQVEEAARPLVEAANIHYAMTLPDRVLFVKGDSVRLTQVARNLISNAIKFSNDNGTVKVMLTQEGREACLRVEDNGIGLAYEEQSRIFTQFAQVDESHGRVHGGLGLGLALVREIISLHGGRVTVTSEGLGHGSTFSVYLPLATKF